MNAITSILIGFILCLFWFIIYINTSDVFYTINKIKRVIGILLLCIGSIFLIGPLANVLFGETTTTIEEKQIYKQNNAYYEIVGHRYSTNFVFLVDTEDGIESLELNESEIRFVDIKSTKPVILCEKTTQKFLIWKSEIVKYTVPLNLE